jgi:sortase A
MSPLKVRMTILLAAIMCILCAGQASALECVSASSISLAPPQAAGLAHSTALPFPTKSNGFVGTLFDAPEDYLFGRPTSEDTIYEREETNVDRSKNAALIPPTFGSPTSYLPSSGTYLTPNLAPGGMDGGLVNHVGSVNYPSVDVGGGSFAPSTSISGTGGYSATAFTEVTDDLYYSGSHLGTLKIPSIGLTVKVYEGTDSAALAKGAGHFEDTSIWDGNVALAAHNRGVNNHFGQIHTLEIGDTITLTTKLGTRTYEVTSVSKVSETDRSGLAASTENLLTLYTCVRDQRELRWCVTAVEKTG